MTEILKSVTEKSYCEQSERGGEALELAREIFLTSYGKSIVSMTRPSRFLTSYFLETIKDRNVKF